VIAGTLLYSRFGNRALQGSRREVYELLESQRDIASEIEESLRLFEDFLETLDSGPDGGLRGNATQLLFSIKNQTSELSNTLEKYRMRLLGPDNPVGRLVVGSHFVVQKEILLQEIAKRDKAFLAFTRTEKKLRKMFDLLSRTPKKPSRILINYCNLNTDDIFQRARKERDVARAQETGRSVRAAASIGRDSAMFVPATNRNAPGGSY
jgi:hypothetical protein